MERAGISAGNDPGSRRPPGVAPVLLLAHRGVHDMAEENSAAAFEAARAQGLDGVETDVRITGDGQLVLLHDRLLRDGRAVSQLSRAAIEAALGRVLHTPAEALETWPSLRWNFELKSRAAAGPLLDLLSRHRSAEVLVTSFWHDVALAAATQVPAGVLIAHAPARGQMSWTHLRRAGLHAVVCALEFLDESLLRALRRARLAPWAFGPQGAEDHRRCAALDLDGVITDEPHHLLRP